MPHKKKTINELAEEVGGMYVLTVAAAKRAKQLKEGRARVTDCASPNPLTVAIQELLEGKVIVRPLGDGEKDEAAEPEVALGGITVQVQPPITEAEAAETPEEETPAEEPAAE
jgi:DNA-directed RNA polymerase omega subunit